ncbi:HAMP domain-containing histidine kinase [Kovacikia minuta CCNUW1]|uniref:sensor histidine kinase n=1 Tax=Kovacikia minuta TaxID=2931930 RepID=UPI001CC95A4D|nr:HAMP domain-containing sensor histidine kinase [Kovacikia minuta]UBF27903.1 HAMP domain-containing histidine kinase [Kovacikia minuta CCNUW1]
MQELQNLNQVKDLLLHAVSHDLRTPIQGMLMVFNRLRSKCKDCETVTISRSMLDLMIQSSDQQLCLLNSLRENQVSNEPEVRLVPQPITLNHVLHTTLESLHSLLHDNQATLTNRIPDELPLVKADPIQLQRVLENLLINALKHNSPNRTLTLTASVLLPETLHTPHPTPHTPHLTPHTPHPTPHTPHPTPHTPHPTPHTPHPLSPLLYCAITDNGNGMNQEKCDRLFKPYVRSLDNPHCTGIGLGLHRCRQIITAHGGQIGVTSEPGVGTTIWFTLPLVEKGLSAS